MLPAKIKGLNQDTSDESNDEEEETTIITKEALEQKTQQGYRDALVLQRQNKLSEAEKLLKELLQSDILAQAVGKVQFINGKLQPSMSHLKYCCYLNLGNVLSQNQDFGPSLDYYLKATDLDDTDLNLWYKIGNVAMKIPNLMLAISAFTQALIRNHNHWPSLDSIISASYATGDYMATLLYVSQALKLDPDYLKGIVLKERIVREHPVWVKDFNMFYPESTLGETKEFDESKAKTIFESIDALKLKDPALNVKLFHEANKTMPTRSLLKPLKNRSWLCLGKSLLKLYKFLYDCDSETAFFSYIDMKIAEDEDRSREKSETDAIVPVLAENTPMEVDEIPNSEGNATNKSADDEKISGNDEDDDEDDEDVLTELVAVSSKANENEKDANEGTSKPTKRRKCSPTLADQLKICDKRRSTRNKTVLLKSNEQSLSKILKNIIPASLLPEKNKASKDDCYDSMRWNEDSFDTMDIYKLLFEYQDQSNLPSHPKNDLCEESKTQLIKDQSYFDTEKENHDIEWYISLNNHKMILELFEAFLGQLSSKWNLLWPAKLSDIFVEMYDLLIKHGFEGARINILEQWNKTSEFEEDSIKLLRSKIEMILMHGELLLNQYLENPQNEQPLGSSLLGGTFSTLLFGDLRDGCAILNTTESSMKLYMRLYWLEALLFLQKKDTYSTCSALALLIEQINDPNIEIRLPNMKQFHFISLSGTRRLLNTLVRNQNLNEVKILFSENQYDRVIEILLETLKPGCQELMYLPNENTLSRYQQFQLLFAALWESKKYEELFRWCEVGCYEGYVIYRKSFFDDVDSDMKSKWAGLVINTLSGMLSCLQTNGATILDTLESEHLARLAQTLSNLVCHQIEATEPSPEIIADVVTPWILLANIVSYNERKESELDENAEPCILPSVSLLLLAHEHLGKRNWCCFDDGALLFYTLDAIEPIFHSSAIFSETWMTLCELVDQIFYCLYAHPYKRTKARHVQEHNSPGLALTWNRAIQAFSFYRPTTLPKYDAPSKSCTISADTETLLKRIVSLVPEEQNPTRFIETMQQYMNGAFDEIPENENRLQEEVADLYYLLGDYHFKNKVMAKAIKYYSYDVCSNPHRVDSWAAMALARGSQLETKLNSCETITNECDILKRAELTDKCYRTAFKLDYYDSSLWIEFGVFCYGIHGFCSRLLKQETTTLSMEMFNAVEENKNNFLKTSFMSFNNANDAWLELMARQEEVQDERWFHHYLLGKIAEKKEEHITVALNHYVEAAKFLHENGAEYPIRIIYSSPQHYSVEALEIYYRLHASILKLLETHEERPLKKSTVDSLLKLIVEVQDSPFARARINATKLPESSAKNSEKMRESHDNMNADIEKNDTDTCVEEDVKTILQEVVQRVVDQADRADLKRKSAEELADSNEQVVKKQRNETGQTAPLADSHIDSTSITVHVPESMNVEEGLPKDDSKEPEKTKSKTPSVGSSVRSSSIRSSSDSETSGDSSSSTSESDDEADENLENEKKRECMDRAAWLEARKTLVEKCVQALEECKRRFPEHYKTFYRLAHHYFRSKLDKDVKKARMLLLEEDGLFADRTNKNFFGGIWRIPAAEVDRPGSFAFHMSRSIHLLLDVLRDTKDYKTLLDMSMQLRNKPDLDKRYLRDNEREEISREALLLSGQTLRKIIDDLPVQGAEEAKQALLLDVYKCYHRVVKNFSQKEAPLGKLLVAAFHKFVGRKDKVSIEQILSYCKTLSIASKSGNPGAVPSPLPMIPVHPPSFLEESDVSKALTQVINMALNDHKPPLHNFPAPAHQAMLQKLSTPPDMRAPSYYRSLPGGLSLLPPSISVTAVAKSKSSSQPGWEASKNPPSLKMKPLKRLNTAPKPDKPVTKPKSKEKQYKSKNLSTQADPKGLSILPVSVPVPPAGVFGGSKSHTAPIIPKAQRPKLTMNEFLNANKDNLGLVITPVDHKSQQPTLQQKLAAKQMANSTRNASSAGPVSGPSRTIPKSTAPPKPNAIISSGYDISRGLASSNVHIYPMPVIDPATAVRFGGREAPVSITPQFHHYLPGVPRGPSSTATSSLSITTKTKAAKKAESVDLNRLKAMSKSLTIETPASKLKQKEETLKNSFKALENNKDIVITAHKPKLPKSSEIEIIPLKDGKK